MTQRDANILIVGAGPVGLAAALELSRRGFQPRIVDKGEDFTPVEQSRALGVNNRTLQLLTPSGVADDLLAEGHMVKRLRIVNEKGRDVILSDFQNADALHPFMLIVPQGRTERLLAQALKARGVEVEWNTEMIGANDDPKSPAVTLIGPKGEETVSPDMLIGADGSGSATRKAFGFSFGGEGYPAEFGLADVELDEDFDASEVVFSFSADGALGRIPMGGRRVRYVSPRPDISKALPPGVNVKAVIWRSNFRISFRHVRTMRNGAVFLAGDAAHVHSPVGARGMNLGIEDACWLAWLIEQGRVERYSALRLPSVNKVIAQTKHQTDILLRMNMFERFVRDHMANALIKLAPFKRAALSRLTGLDSKDPPWLARNA